jgi:uncharacterized repeat protein (TIGR03803 family)
MVGFEIGANPNVTATVRAPLYLRDDGYFYGSAPGGGAFGKGALLKISKGGWIDSLPFSGGVQVTGSTLNQPGEEPAYSLSASSDGWLWGTTSGGDVTRRYGTIFRVKPETGEYQRMHDVTIAPEMEGNAPSGGLVPDGQGNFWGVTRYTGNGNRTHGTLFRINERTGDFKRVYTFPGTSASAPSGRVPAGGLHYDGAGNLWGTTSLGGAHSYGTVFKYNIGEGTLTNVVHFSGNTVQPNAIKGSDAISALVPDGNGFLWGVTSYIGYTAGNGSVFKVDMATGTATTVLEFSNNGATNKGINPQGPLTSDGAGNLWGVTISGGALNRGTVFKISSATGALTTVLQFGNLTGANANVYSPWNGLTHDGEGNLWGIATTGGTATPWVVYKVRISDGALTKVAEQATGGISYKGNTPLAGLAGNAISPWLWGTTSAGGANNLGTLFRHNPSTGEHNTVIHFTGTTGTALGAKPNGRVFVDASGVVWGTTENGGAFGSTTGYGTIFKYDPTPGTFTTVQSFNSGIRPKGDLVGMSDGFIWGTTSNGISGSVGTVFKIDPATHVVSTVHNFTSATSSTNGSEPVGRLVEDASGFVWGVAQKGGASSNGMLFKINVASGAFTPLRSFTSSSNQQSGDLVMDASGNLYGSNTSRIFKYVPSTSTFADVFITDYPGGKEVKVANLYRTSTGEIRFLGTEGVQELASPNQNYPVPQAVIYQVDPNTNVVSKLRVLATGIVGPSTPADLPTVGGLYEHSDGNFYGITHSSGTTPDLKPAGGGMIYRVSTGPLAMTLPYSSPSASTIFTLISGTTVTLRGYANPNGNAINCQFEWGPTTQLGNVVNVNLNANTPVGPGFKGGLCEAVLTGLSANTTYFFRLRATSSDGATTYGPIRSIQTGAAVASAAARIRVESPIGQPLTGNLNKLDLGRHRVGSSHQQSIVARNLGPGIAGVSELTGLTATISGPHASEFVITTPFDLTQLSTTSSMSTGMIVTFTPSGGGIRTATLTITSNDADNGSFEIPLTGEGLLQPEIEVDSPAPLALQSDEDKYDFGGGAVNQGTHRTFTIRNTGNAPLGNLSVMVAGIHTRDFAVTRQPPASIAPGSSGTFAVTFTPSLVGARSATLQITSDDEDENPFIIPIGGSGVIGPEIQVFDDTHELTDGVSTLAHVTLTENGSFSRVITIRNIGSANLTGISLSLVGANAADFFYGPVASSVAAGEQTTFNLTFSPQSPGVKSATLRIASNDSDENPFDILLSGITMDVLTDPLADFLASAGIPSDLRGPNDDADNDGLANLLEYALDLNPNGSGGAFSGSLPSMTRTATQLELTYRRVRSDIIYLVETSNDPSSGSWNTAGVTQGTPASDGTTTASIPLSNGKAFLRLSVTSAN